MIQGRYLLRRPFFFCWGGFLALAASLAAGAPGGSTAHSGSTGAKPDLVCDGGVRVTSDELRQLVGDNLIGVLTQEYDLKRQVLEEKIGAVLLEREAARFGLAASDLVRKEIDAKVTQPSTEEVRAVYDAVRERFAGQSAEVAQGLIRDNMNRQRITARRTAYLLELRKAAAVRVLLEPPRAAVPLDGGIPRGPADARAVLVLFSDYQCPFCAQLMSTVRAVQEKHPNQVRLVLLDYPLPFHQDAGLAAEAAHCAAEKGRAWEMIDLLFKNQTALTRSDLVKYAGEAGIDSESVAACLLQGEHRPAWQRGLERGKALGVKVTPTLFVNGRFFEGAIPYERLEEIVQEELDRAKATPSPAS